MGNKGLLLPDIGSARRRCGRLKRSPKLFLAVEVDVLLDGRGGVSKVCGSSIPGFLSELTVDDLPRIPSLMRLGDEWFDVLEALESCRIKGDPGAANSIVALAIALDADGEVRSEERRVGKECPV